MKPHKVLIKIIGWKFNIIGLFSPRTALIQALTLFAKPKNGRVFSYHRKHLDSFVKDFIEVNGLKIQTYKKGSGKIHILLAHGWESNSWRWRKLLRFMGLENYTFIALDAPGHGSSEPDHFDLLLYAKSINEAALKYNPDYIIGHSIGGLAILLACAKFHIPEHIKIISMGAPHSLESIFEKYFNFIGLSNKIRTKTGVVFQKKYDMTLDNFSIKKIGAAIKNAGLIIHDINDKTNEISNAETIAESWVNAQLLCTNVSNHSMQNEIIYTIIVDYIKT